MKSLNEFRRENEIASEAIHNDMIRGKKVQDWPDEVILDQYNKLLVLYDQEMVDHLSELGAKSYTIKIIEEVKKRNLIDGKAKAEALYD